MESHQCLDTNMKTKKTFPPTRREIWQEFVAIVDFTCFIFACAILYYLMFPISTIFVGRLGTLYLDAVGLGNTIFNVFGILVYNGFMTGADTTMAQSYGTSNKKMIGVYFQRTFITGNVLLVMVCIAIMLNSESLLVLVGQNREVARLAGIYVTLLTIGLPFFGFWALSLRFFRTQGVIWPAALSVTIMLAVTILLHYLFVTVLGWGLRGSAAAQIIAFGSGTVTMLIISPLQTEILRQSWGGVTREAWQDWGSFTLLSFTGLFVICLQWWGLEICTLLAGTLGRAELAVQAIVFQINYFIYTIPASIGISLNFLIGQHVGRNDPYRGKLSMVIGLMITWIMSIIAIILLLCLKDIIPRLFSQEDDVIALTSETLPYLALYHVFDSTVNSSLGMCRGVARQKMGSIVSFIGIYVVGLPCAVYLTFYTRVGLKGLWIGPTLGLAAESLTLLFLLAKTNWSKECEAAQIRAGLDPNKNDTETAAFKIEDIEDESTALLAEKHQKLTKRYGPEYASSQTDISVLRIGSKLSTGQLVFRRGLTVILCVLVFLVGVIMHFMVTPTYSFVDHSNSTTVNDSLVPTLP